MNSMNRPVHFEIHAQDPTRAANFYKTVFGWKIDQWGDNQYWMVVTGEDDPQGSNRASGEYDKENPSKYTGINGGMMIRKGEAPVDGQPVNAYVCSLFVENIDESIKKIESAGGKMAVAKFAFPGMAWQAYYKDTEGNIFGLHQADENAK